jgi:hypothetical protein
MLRAFISHTRADDEAAAHLVSLLTARGAQVVRLDQLTEPGESWVADLTRAITDCDVFFVLISPHSEKSQWMETEIAFALAHSNRSQSKKGGPVIVPVLLTSGVKLPVLLESIQGIELYEADRCRNQLDSLFTRLEGARSIESFQLGQRHSREAEFDSLVSSQEALSAEIAIENRQRAKRSVVIIERFVGLVSFGFFVVLVSYLFNFRLFSAESPKQLIGRIVPFAIGMMASTFMESIVWVLKRAMHTGSRGKESE